MKKSLCILMCVLLAVSFLWGCNNTDESETNKAIVSTPDETGARQSQIAGFTPDKTMTTVSLPHTMGKTMLQVISVGRYSGYYTEDGSNTSVTDVVAVVVQNVSSKFIRNATVTGVGSDGKEYKFPFTCLPAGRSVLILESSKSTLPSNQKISALATGVVETSDAAELHADKVKITFENGNFNVKNLTDKNFSAVYIRYKSYTSGNVYMGGVTYSATVENLSAHSEKQCKPLNFYDGYSEILMVHIAE